MPGPHGPGRARRHAQGARPPRRASGRSRRARHGRSAGYAPGVIGSALVLLVSAVAAAPRPAALSWVRLDGAEACMTAPALAAAVEARLGRAVFASPAEAELTVEGRAERVGAGWRAVLRVSERGGGLLGEREVRSAADSCEELDRTVVVALSLMIDPLAPVEAAPPPPPPPPPPPRWGVEVDGALFVGAGLVPGVGVGGLSAVYVTPPGWVPLWVHGALVPYATVEGTVAAQVLRAEAGLGVCPLDVGPTAVALRGCLGVDAGGGFVVEAPAAVGVREVVLVQAHAAVTAHWTVVDRLVLRAGVHGVVPLRAAPWSVGTDAEVAWQAAPVAGYADLGLGVRF